jgi:hypothetical protein
MEKGTEQLCVDGPERGSEPRSEPRLEQTSVHASERRLAQGLEA